MISPLMFNITTEAANGVLYICKHLDEKYPSPHCTSYRKMAEACLASSDSQGYHTVSAELVRRVNDGYRVYVGTHFVSYFPSGRALVRTGRESYSFDTGHPWCDGHSGIGEAAVTVVRNKVRTECPGSAGLVCGSQPTYYKYTPDVAMAAYIASLMAALAVDWPDYQTRAACWAEFAKTGTAPSGLCVSDYHCTSTALVISHMHYTILLTATGESFVVLTLGVAEAKAFAFPGMRWELPKNAVRRDPCTQSYQRVRDCVAIFVQNPSVNTVEDLNGSYLSYWVNWVLLECDTARAKKHARHYATLAKLADYYARRRKTLDAHILALALDALCVGVFDHPVKLIC